MFLWGVHELQDMWCDFFLSLPVSLHMEYPLPIKEGKTYNECLKTQLPYPWNIFLFVNDHFILQELIKSAKLEESMKELDIEKRRTDSLLYQMIPRTVADRLRQGEPALNTCEVCKFTTPCHLPVLIGHCN